MARALLNGRPRPALLLSSQERADGGSLTSGTKGSNPLSSSGESVSARSRGRCRLKSRLLRGSGPGLGREKGTRWLRPGLFGPVSLTGLDAVPLRQKRRPVATTAGRGGAAACSIFPDCAAQLASSLRCSVQSNGRSSSVRRVAVRSTGCRPCKIASTSSGLKKARPTSRRI